MRLLAKSLCTLATILTLALPAAAGEAPAEQASGKPSDCLVKVESPIQHTPVLSAKLPNSSEMSTADAPEAVLDPAVMAWLARLDASGPSKSACCCGITYQETTSAGCGGGKACQYARSCTTCYGCGPWSLTSMGGCGACPTP